MKQNVLEKITALDVEIIVLDIDGTLKDLASEHKETLSTVLNCFIKGKKTQKRMICLVDKIAMWFVKAGILPTNERMQRILTTMYAIFLFENISEFRKQYEFFYRKEIVIFDEMKQLLEEISKAKDIYFVTINKQNYNLEEQGIASDKIIYTMSKKKVKAYKRLIEEKKLDKSKILIVGDNLFDDIKSAKKLGIKYLLVDNYDSKFKRFIARILNVGM